MNTGTNSSRSRYWERKEKGGEREGRRGREREEKEKRRERREKGGGREGEREGKGKEGGGREKRRGRERKRRRGKECRRTGMTRYHYHKTVSHDPTRLISPSTEEISLCSIGLIPGIFGS